MRWMFAIGGLIAALLLPSAASAEKLVPIAPASAWSWEPIYLTAPESDERVFVVERGGVIRVVKDGAVKPQPFLTITNVSKDVERGLLSMAFAPDYAQSGLSYVFYTANGPDSLDPTGQVGDIRVVEYKRSASDPDVVDPSSARLVLRVPHPDGSHNGGWLGFGPDDLLYMTVGDNVISLAAQDPGSLYGKVLRIDPTDPDGAGPLTATIPPGNPFVGVPGAREEVYASGLRNPFRASFAPNGSLIVGDVGEEAIEEINVITSPGMNLGWPVCEGSCNPANPLHSDPFFQYDHATNSDCAVLSGYVVGDPELSTANGKLVYGDLCNPDLRTLDLSNPAGNPGALGVSTPTAIGENLRSFGVDGLGCTYVVTSKNVLRIAPDANPTKDCQGAVPPDPEVPEDAKFNFHVPLKRALSGLVTVSGKCSVNCDIQAAGTVHISRNRFRKTPAKIKLSPVAAGAQAGVRTDIGLVLPGKTVKKLRAAQRKGSRVTVYVKVSARTAKGSTGSGTGTIRLLPPR